MKKIIYLHADASADLEDWESVAERDELVKTHPESKTVTLEQFARYFNADGISDLGYMVIVDAGEIETKIKEKIAQEKKQVKEYQHIIDGGCNNDEEEIGYGENIFESNLVIKTLEKILED